MPVALRTAEVILDGSLVHGRGTVESGSGALTDLPVTWAARTEAPGRKDEPRGVGCRRARDVLQHGTRARARGSEDTACTQATSASCVLDEVDGAPRIQVPRFASMRRSKCSARPASTGRSVRPPRSVPSRRPHAHDRVGRDHRAEWRTDVVARIVAELGLEQVMFEAADPASSPGTSRTTGSTSTSSSTTAKSSSSSACAPASGARTTPGRMLAYRG